MLKARLAYYLDGHDFVYTLWAEVCTGGQRLGIIQNCG